MKINFKKRKEINQQPERHFYIGFYITIKHNYCYNYVDIFSDYLCLLV